MDETLTGVKLDEATTRYDAAFRDVHGLTWLPWVGQCFSERPPHQRLLVVGESHYFHGKTPEERQANREKWLKYSQYTRDVVSESLIHREWTTPTLSNIPKLLFKTAEIDHFRLWGDCAYYNIVQRMMDYKQDGQPERPTGDDFIEGWKVFAEVVRIIQPSHCLFIGVGAADSFDFSMTSQKLSFEKISWPQKIGRTWARMAKLEIAGKSTNLIFVQHLGKYFSWEQWHNYLQSQHADFMSWLGAELYAIDRKVQSVTESVAVSP